MKRKHHVFSFPEKELSAAENEVWFTLNLKFLKGHPYLEQIKVHVNKWWGLFVIPLIRILDMKHIMAKLKNKEDFAKSMDTGGKGYGGISVQVFHWTLEFNGREESSLTPVWMTLLDLPIQYSLITSGLSEYFWEDS